ncbi:hypothetical protein [Kaistia algarum]|uniref:hypothetical protein n=1 Tax=Kaistia algarum TaxID=2083279 RepID=UPI00225B96DB|nr:hypothetical protein [Kaistia algarum]MCX5515922.1 hypothetical protein [Kaistia algarum]
MTGDDSAAATRSLGKSASVEEQRNLLTAMWISLSPVGPDVASVLPAAVDAEIKRRLAPGSGLADLNVAEQLLINGVSGPALDEAIARKLVEAKRRGIPDAAESAARYTNLMAQAGLDDTRKRAFLLGIVTDLQHFGLRSAQVRFRRSQAIAFVSRLTRWAVGFAMLPFLIFLLHRASLVYPVAPLKQVGGGIAWIVTTFPNYGLYTAVTFGAVGALFSRYTRFQEATITAVPLDDADAYYSSANVLLHLLIGTVGAMFIYFFAASGLLTGPLVPDLRALTYVAAKSPDATGPFCNLLADPVDCRVEAEKQPAPCDKADNPCPDAVGTATSGSGDGTAGGGGTENTEASKEGRGITTVLGILTPNALVPSRDLALLIIWAILAGFSERLVPNLLTSTTRQIEARAAETEAKTVVVQTSPVSPNPVQNDPDAEERDIPRAANRPGDAVVQDPAVPDPQPKPGGDASQG